MRRLIAGVFLGTMAVRAVVAGRMLLGGALLLAASAVAMGWVA